MKINELNTLDLSTVTLKFSDNSITVKQGNKTKAVINNVTLASKLQFNKKVELNTKFGSKLNKFFDKLYIGTDNSINYFINNSYLNLVNQLAENGNNEELETLNENIAILSNLNINVYYVNVT